MLHFQRLEVKLEFGTFQPDKKKLIFETDFLNCPFSGLWL